MTNSKFKFIIFDLGDTLFKQKHLIEQIIDEIQIPLVIKAGYESITREEFTRISEKTNEKFKKYDHIKQLKEIGLWPKIFFKQIGINISHDFAREWDLKFRKYLLDNIEFMPDVLEILNYLKSKKKKMIVITNSSVNSANFKLKKFKLEKYFNLIVISEEIGYPKSSLKPFKFVLKKMGGKPSDYLMIGNSIEEDMCAKKLGIKTALLNKKNKINLKDLDESIRPDYVIKSLYELKGVV